MHLMGVRAADARSTQHRRVLAGAMQWQRTTTRDILPAQYTRRLMRPRTAAQLTGAVKRMAVADARLAVDAREAKNISKPGCGIGQPMKRETAELKSLAVLHFCAECLSRVSEMCAEIPYRVSRYDGRCLQHSLWVKI
jgi:hypothetical protein